MKFILFLISLNSTTFNYDLVEVSRFDAMDTCFDVREKIVQNKGRPIINYQAVCIRDDTRFSTAQFNKP